jgi:hypothetical protein
MKRWFATSFIWLAAALSPACNCDELVVVKVAPMLQLQHADEAVEQPLCAVGDEFDCALDFGPAGISLFNHRSLVLANKASVPLTIYEVRLAQDSPQLPELALDWSESGKPVLAGKDYVALKVFWTPTFAMEEGQLLGHIEVYTNADNAEEALDEETCIAAGAVLGCGVTRVAIRGQGANMGLPEAKIVARVGSNAWDNGPCDFGFTGVNRQSNCRVEITNLGERDLLIFGAELGFREAPRSDCQTCEGQQWCGGENAACVDGPFAAEETGEAGVWEERNSCDGENPCPMGKFCALDATDPAQRFCSIEAEAAAGRSIFRFIEQPAFSREHPLVVTPGTSTTLQLAFQPAALRRYTSRLSFTTNVPDGEMVVLGILGVGHNMPTAVPRVLSVSGGPPNRDGNGVAQVAPSDSVVLTSEDSYGANGAAITAQEWSFSEDPDVGAYLPTDSHLRFVAPEGETTALEFENNINTYIRGIDIIGAYRAALRVRDEHGVWSEWATVDFLNIPGDSVHIELTWDHPSSDVDLHLLRTADRGAYTGSNDCYYANCKPDMRGNPRLNWGAGAAEDDPVLDVDDVNGFGPENINIDSPEDGQAYMVGVHYFRDAAGGEGGLRSTIATIRIYVWERLVYEEIALLEADEAWWQAATIEWNSGNVDDGDAQMFTEPPPRGGGGFP